MTSASLSLPMLTLVRVYTDSISGMPSTRCSTWRTSTSRSSTEKSPRECTFSTAC